jgi:tRNA threonylcarbamoyladenosine biosynthesis protein TsaE
MDKTVSVITNSPEETMETASKIAVSLEGGDLVALIGQLGTGKTVFVKGIAKGLGVDDHLYVNSPSFVVLKEYRGNKDLYHFDVYRLEPESFCETMDYEKYFYGDGITVVEWADKIPDILPDEYLRVELSHENGNKRRFEFSAVGEKYRKIVDSL